MTEEQFTQAQTFWSRKDEIENKMDPAALYNWISAFLTTHKVLALATGTGNYIRCTPLEYTWHDGALWIFTEGGFKFKGLKKNKNVAAAIF
ncbi:MAG: pyridoxamine 5'-phosphate oxidase family protein, partial [Clostridiales bacterium]|nr:pyridoxamine 5'-phosphate oxidase family protein [Clostridiales bacterium]